VAPANPAITSAFVPIRRTFLALAFMIVGPKVTWPSPPMATLPPLRTETMVVPWKVSFWV
jgi:hypothetical protein